AVRFWPTFPESASRRLPALEECGVTTSEPPGVVPTRRLYVSPAVGVLESVAALHENVALLPATFTARFDGAVGGVLETRVLFRYSPRKSAPGAPVFPAIIASRSPSLS